MIGGRRLVRYREDAFEMRCDSCKQWWHLTPEFWPKSGLVNCRPCTLEYKRLKQRGYMTDEARREVARVKDRLSYREHRPARLAANRAWKAANRERVAAYNKAYRAAHKAEIAAHQRAYYAEAPEIMRLKKRFAYDQETPEQREHRRACDRARYAARKAAA